MIREVFSLRSLIRPGNSGGPLVSRDGQVLGVVFAASVTDDATGYALTAEQVEEAAAEGILQHRAPATARPPGRLRPSCRRRRHQASSEEERLVVLVSCAWSIARSAAGRFLTLRNADEAEEAAERGCRAGRR